MGIVLKYYDLINFSLIDTQEERYNLRIAKCGHGSSFPFSYANTQGKRIDVQILLGFQSTFFSEFRFTIYQPNEIPVLILEDLMPACVFMTRIVRNQDYVLKRHPYHSVRPNIFTYYNKNVSDLCYMTAVICSLTRLMAEDSF
ncbi:hypothetical protein RF11_10926 [Thelohanellus kitauei]|uniref:Uncharacterized protein n=1 Tax=Thelohanellus kitauei TaxID=669202 RepID=A0A0C2ISW5_THEKT|nr:hypothetical protein RF11_10926 [Thelohanellus kitauei]